MSAVRISRVVSEAAKKLIKVEWENGLHSSYSMAWLRDNCRCSGCFHQNSKSRTLMMKNLNPEKLFCKNISPDSSSVSLEWNDGHVTELSASWLRARDHVIARRRNEDMATKNVLWDRRCMEDMGSIPRLNYEDVLKEDSALKDWLRLLRDVGLVLLEGCPLVEGPADRIAERIGFYKSTHYGGNFTLKAQAEPNNLAYSSHALGLHTDLPYYDCPAGALLFHCIQQFAGEGGDSEFCDGFWIAEILKAEDPVAYETLTTTPVTFWDFGQEDNHNGSGSSLTFLKRRSTVTIETKDNKVFRVNYNNPGRDSFLPLDPETVNELYRALKKFDEICYRPENLIVRKLKPGEMVAFNNYRILHGRKGFIVKDNGYSERHFHGGFLDWDEINSRYNRLTLQDFQNEF